MISVETILQDRYRIDDVIGRGGMGAVYLAYDLRLDCRLAIKETLFSDEELRRQFLREARLLANLRHPALPRVTDHFVELDSQFLVMEFIPGDDLASQLKQRKRPVELETVLRWSFQLLDALEYLHRHKPPVIHRDIKPQNLKVNERGQIILLDFGLAKGAPQLVEAASVSSTVFGYTLNYAPIEQIQGKGTDPRGDLFSLGATIYHLATGVTPPGALTRAAELAIKNSDPLLAANEINPDVPVSIAKVIARAMALNPDDRPANAAHFAVELREAAGDIAIGPALLPAAMPGKPVPLLKTNEGKAEQSLPSEADKAPDAYGTYAEPAARKTVINAPTKAEIERARRAHAEKRIKEETRGALVGTWVTTALIVLAIIFVAAYAISDSDSTEATRTTTPSTIRVTPPPAPPTPPPRVPPIPVNNEGALLDGGPVILRPRDGIVGDKQKVINLEWSSVPNAAKYRVETIKETSIKENVGITSATHFSLPSSKELMFVRIIAIFPAGDEIFGTWKPIGTAKSIHPESEKVSGNK